MTVAVVALLLYAAFFRSALLVSKVVRRPSDSRHFSAHSLAAFAPTARCLGKQKFYVPPSSLPSAPSVTSTHAMYPGKGGDVGDGLCNSFASFLISFTPHWNLFPGQTRTRRSRRSGSCCTETKQLREKRDKRRRIGKHKNVTRHTHTSKRGRL